MTDEQKAAVLRAADWLAENRDRHIAGEMSMTANGRSCRPNDPHAYCFCAIGRIGYELGGDFGFMVDVALAAGLSGNADLIWRANDLDSVMLKRIFSDTHQGDPRVIALLRKLAA